jgi:hypothetical protein
MLDVHVPHPTHTWKDFFIHIATIVVGLLIAVGLEQSVESLHRRHQVAETRKALEIERRININRFAVMSQEFDRFVPILERNLAVFVALKQHPGSAASLPQLEWNSLNFLMVDGAWQTAKQTNVMESMPVAEAREVAGLYRRLEALNVNEFEARKALFDATLFAVADPDPTHLSAQQLDRQIELTGRVLLAFKAVAVDQFNLNRQFSDFSPTPRQEVVQAISHQAVSPEYRTYSDQMIERVSSFEKAQTKESSPSP